MDIKTVPQPPYSPELASCDFWLFPKLTGCRYETIEEMKEAVAKVIDTLTQEDFDGPFQKLLERYNAPRIHIYIYTYKVTVPVTWFVKLWVLREYVLLKQ